MGQTTMHMLQKETLLTNHKHLQHGPNHFGAYRMRISLAVGSKTSWQKSRGIAIKNRLHGTSTPFISICCLGSQLEELWLLVKEKSNMGDVICRTTRTTAGSSSVTATALKSRFLQVHLQFVLTDSPRIIAAFAVALIDTTHTHI